jgi:asparagine synthase (glutamine-hydrolysing)
MTTFDEAGRIELYSDRHLDWLVATATSERDQSEVDPAAILISAFGLASQRDSVTRAMVSDLVTYLPGDLLVKVDLASMAHSLECRGPFLDHRVVELAMAMPVDHKIRFRKGRSKVVLKQAFSDLLPASIKTRSKMGFGVPIGRWFRNELKAELKEVLLDPICLSRGIFRPAAITRLVDEHMRQEREHSHRLWALLMLELWLSQYINSGAVANSA